MDLPVTQSLRMSENLWRGIVIVLSGTVILITFWCLMNGITTIFMHLYYFPIVLLAYHYRWKGFGLATLLALVYLGLVILFDTSQLDVILGAFYRFLIFVGIAAVIAYLSEWITFEKRSAQESAEIREQYISLAPAIILVLDRNGTISYLNPRGCEILECSTDDVIGKSWFNQFLPEKDREVVKQVFSDLIAGQVEPNRIFENRVLTPSGRERIIRWHNTVLHGEGQAISGTLGFGEDITEEKEAQESLRKMQQFQESVISNANVWISVLAPDGTILVWNDAAEAISGYKKADVIGKNTIWKRLYPDNHYRKKVTTQIQRIIGRDTILENFETEIRCEDWTTKTIVWNTRGLRDDRGIVTSYIAIGRDVTAQKIAEYRAGESSRFLGAMIDTLPTPIFFKDASGKYLGCNPPFEEYLGITRDQIVGKSVYDLSPKDLADTYAAADQQLFDNPVPQRYETQVQYADGSRHDVIFFKAPFFNKDGTLGGLIGTFLDITDRKQMEDALHKSEERYRNVLENVPDLILVHRDGTILYVNPPVTEVMGYAHDELINRKITDFVVPEYYPQIAQATSLRMDGKIIAPYEIDILTKAGRRLTVTVRGSLIDFDGAPASLNVLTDITERKRAEEALRESEEKYRAFFTTSRDCVFITTLDGSWLDFNDAAVELFGYENREDLLNIKVPQVYANPVERDAHIRYIRENGYSFEYPVDLKKKDGTIINTLITTVARKDAAGNILGFQGSIRDVTERKRTEELLLENQKQLANAMDLAKLADWEFDVLTGIFTFNDRFYAMYGTTAEREGGYRMRAEDYTREFVHPDDAGLVAEEVRKAVDTADPLFMSQVEHRIIRRDGAIRYIIVRHAVTKDAEGRTIKTHGANQDITERTRAEEALRNSESRLHTLVQTIPDLIWLKDKEGIYLSCNTMFERFFGAKEADIIGKTDYDFVNKELADFFCENDRNAMAAGKPTRNEEWITFADDGHRALLETTKTPVFDDKGTLIGVLGIGRDITDRKHAEEEREKVRWWQAGVNRILESVLSTGSLDEKLIVVTEGVVDIFGADFCRIWLIDRGDRCEAGCMHAGVTEGPHVCRYRDKCLHLRASSGRYTHLDGKAHGRVPFGAYKIGRIASGDDIKFLTNDVEHDPRVHDHAWAKSLGLVGFAGYRLKPHDGDVLGVFALFTQFPISPDMDAILEGLSRAISLAIQKDLADRALRENEMRLNEVSEMAHVGGWELDIATMEVHWTKETYRIHDLPDDAEYDRANAVLFFDMPGRTRLEAALQQCMEHGDPFDLELPFTSAKGKHLWTRALGRAVKTNGRIVKLTGTFQDITERKQVEEALRESRQLFSDIISFLPDPTFVIDKDGVVLAWNRAIEQISGVPAKDMIGRGDHEYSLWLYGKRRPILIDLVLHPDLDAGRLNYTGIRWEGRTVTAQTEFLRSGGDQKVPLMLVASPLIDSLGNVTGAIESMRDISSVKEAEAALARLNASLETIVRERTQKLEEEIVQRMQAEKNVQAALDYTRSVIEANPDLVVVLDEAGVILDVNAAGERLTGIPKAQLVGTPYFGYLVEDGTVQSAFAGLLQEGTIENFVRIRRTDGHVTPLSVHATVVRGWEGDKVRIIVSAHDITRQKQDEETLRTALDEQVLLLREVHHRVKNNLQIIISLVNLQMRQTDDPEVKKVMSETQNRVRAMSLVHEKLYRSKSLSRIDFADYTRFLATQLFSFYDMDTRRVRLDMAMGKIMVDINTAVPLGLLMNELISNAIRHAFPNGREGTISISGSEADNLITLSVHDNGIGIPEELDWKNTTSLGMRLVTSLIDQVDGTLVLDREDGTRFSITVKMVTPHGGAQ